MLKHLFWDSCVFIRYITRDDGQPHFQDIARFVGEAKAGKRQIYYSTITLAEFRQDHFAGSDFGSVRDFFEDMGSACIPIEPNPNVMIVNRRPIGTPDRRAKGTPLAMRRSVDEGREFRPAGGVGRA